MQTKMQKKAFQRRSQLLKATFKAVADKGYDSVTLQDIADYAELSKGVTNYYFKNKEEIFYYLFIWITERIYQNERVAVDNEESALGKLNAYVNAVFSSPQKNKEFYRVYLEFLAQANNNPSYRKINLQFYKNCWGIGEEIVMLGQSEGIFGDVDVERAKITIRSLIDGCLIQWLMRDIDELHEFYKDTCYRSIVLFLTNKERQS